jgi:hypothetical protein
MNTIKRIEARTQRMLTDDKPGHLVTADEWAAIKAVVELAVALRKKLPASGSPTLSFYHAAAEVHDFDHALSKLEGE